MESESGLRKFLRFLIEGTDEKIDGDFGVRRFLDPEDRRPEKVEKRTEEPSSLKKYLNILSENSLEKVRQQERVRGRLDVLGILQVLFDDCESNDEFCEKVYKFLKYTNVYMDEDFNVQRDGYFDDLEKRGPNNKF